jgi:hypothetical protein
MTFGGFGRTLIACENRGRQAPLIDLDPKSCDVVVRRWQGVQPWPRNPGRRWPDLQRHRLEARGCRRVIRPDR